MIITIDESVLRQTLDAVDALLITSACYSAYFETDHTNTAKAITALRTALDAAKNVEEQLAIVTRERDELKRKAEMDYVTLADALITGLKEDNEELRQHIVELREALASNWALLILGPAA